MPNRPARFTTADLRRATKAAEQAGPRWFVEILPDGTIRLAQFRDPPVAAPKPAEKEIVIW